MTCCAPFAYLHLLVRDVGITEMLESNVSANILKQIIRKLSNIFQKEVVGDSKTTRVIIGGSTDS
jgi:hypothetical protein